MVTGFCLEGLVREFPYSIYSKSDVFYCANKILEGEACIQKERRKGVALAGRFHFR